jgi:prenyltransferase beta subunit
LDFVHLCCLARSSASLRQWKSDAAASPPFNVTALLRQIEQFRSADGGFNIVAGSGIGTAYACFLALGAYQDLKAEMPNAAGLDQCLQSLQTPDGAWTNELRALAPKPTVGSTNATAAAVTVLRTLGQPIQPGVGPWLLACAHPQGGFLAAPQAPVPDLLSTATALHALAGLEMSFDDLAEPCLDFVDSLWTNEGGFYGHWPDEQVDCEYTYYALLALGHLSLCLKPGILAKEI